MLRIATALALLACSACSSASDDPRLVVRAGSVDGALSSFHVELDGAQRLVRVLEGDDGERIIVIAAVDGQLLALAKTDDDALVEYDVATVDGATIATCDAQCTELDDATAELLDLVALEELSIDDGPAQSWRLASSVQKKLDDTTAGVQSKIG